MERLTMAPLGEQIEHDALHLAQRIVLDTSPGKVECDYVANELARMPAARAVLLGHQTVQLLHQDSGHSLASKGHDLMNAMYRILTDGQLIFIVTIGSRADFTYSSIGPARERLALRKLSLGGEWTRIAEDRYEQQNSTLWIDVVRVEP